MRYLQLFLMVLAIVLPVSGQTNGAGGEAVQVVSPDNQYQMKIYDSEGQIFYSIDYKGKPLVLKSKIGITEGETVHAGGFDPQAVGDSPTGQWAVGRVRSAAKFDAAWMPVYGERSLVIDHYNSDTITLINRDAPRRRISLVVRAYKEGIAFRFLFEGSEFLHIMGETTQYTFPEGTIAYHTATAQAVYKQLPLRNWTRESERPLLLRLPDKTYALLTEAAMTDYARTKFALAAENTLVGKMYGAVDEIAPYATPWRVVMAAERAGALIENNDLLLNLNPPSAIKNTAWIKPGKVMRDVTLSTAGSKALVDFAVAQGLQYIELDAGWYGPEGSNASDARRVNLDPSRNRDNRSLDLAEVIAYARSKGIGVWLYVNQRALFLQLDELLPLYEKWGVAGLKFGFVQVGSQTWTRWLHEAIAKCAEHKLMVDIHDEYRPTGFSRTYPNLLTQEGIYGNEEFPDATHNVTLPFTRFTQGAADYTICYYTQRWSELTQPNTAYGLSNARLLRTRSAHQLAMAVVYYSPLQFMFWYDRPSDSRGEPELDFFRKVPTTWDNTIVINGEPAEYITVARKSGDRWFIGSMTNNDARKIDIPLSFLDVNRKYTATIYYDDPKAEVRTRVSSKTLNVTSKTTLPAELLSSGGQAIIIEPILNSSKAKAFKHPAVLHNESDFAYMRKLLKQGDSLAVNTYNILRRLPQAQHDYQMQGPFPIISRDGEYRGTKGKMESDFSAAYLNALMFALTNDEAHARMALRVLTAYADTLTLVPPTNDAPLLAGLEGFKIIYAMEVLRYLYKTEYAAHQASIERMFKEVFMPVLTKFYRSPAYTNGNWGPIVTKTYMAAGIYFDDRDLYDYALNFYQYGRDNGTIANYISGATGQVQESGRDQGHVQLGIGALATVCEVAWKQGDDIYAALNNRLLLGFEYVAKYNLGNDDVPFFTWTDVTGKYSNWTEISDRSRGAFKPIYDMVYNHYVRRKRLSMPYTEQVLRKIRPEGYERDQPSFGGLLFRH